jgi:hypothetical protein
MPWYWPWSKKKRPLRHLREPIEKHLGTDIDSAHSVVHEVKTVHRINLQQVVDRWATSSSPPCETFGYSATGYLADDGLVKYLVNDELIQAPIERMQMESGPGEWLDCVLRGLYLLWHDKKPVIIGFRPARFHGELPVLEILAATRDQARATLTTLLDEAQRGNVYKGRTICLEATRSWSESAVIRFQELRETTREDIVLPDTLLQVVERNVLGMLKHGPALQAAGRSLRHGLLFHGPPGTGKTMLVRYLARACEQHTILLLTAGSQQLIRESCQIAKLLAPSIVILEDVDLIAEEREQNRCPVLLHELMNEMDGLGPRAEIIFLLTTNRPEILESALSARPGRIDQAIEFPLPDEGCRRRLFAVYGRGLDLTAVDLTRWVGQTDGVSPAFIEELLRKATLMAAERGEVSTPLRLADDDIHNALRELVFFGGELTQKLLGYRTGKMGYTGAQAG